MTGRTHRRIALTSLAAVCGAGAFPLDAAASGAVAGVLAQAVGFAFAAAAALAGAWLPDLDLRSLRRFPWLGRVLPHRGPTHAATVLAALAPAVVAVGASAGFRGCALAFLLGWLTHVVADACTPQGVALCWPWRRRVRLLPRCCCVTPRAEAAACWLFSAVLGGALLVARLGG